MRQLSNLLQVRRLPRRRLLGGRPAVPVLGIVVGVELVEVQWKGSGPGSVLRLVVDRPGGVGLDDCERASLTASAILDAYDPIETRYSLEVSSPGAERPIRTDEEWRAALGRRVLESAGFEVTTHTSSLQALEEFRSNPNQFDLLITDNTMPHMTGLELVAKVLAARPEIPVLMVSGIGESMSVEALKKCGVTRLLSKPYQSTDLQAAARELVAGSRA